MKILHGRGITIIWISILILGILLRLLFLGQDSLWLDEAGVVIVAMSASVSELLAGVRTHAMAMPMDYVITRLLLLNFEFSEFLLRLPAAIWGVGTLVVGYVLLNKLTNKLTALLFMLFLAISPLHIQYSQELRFYSAWIFFYYLSILLLIHAINRTGWLEWGVFVIVTGLGMCFHIFTVLAVVSGVFLWAAQPGWRKLVQANLIKAMFSFLILGGIAVGLYFSFGAGQKFYFDTLFPWGGNLLFSLLHGLGWRGSLYGPEIGLEWLWFGSCFGLAMLGLWLSIKRKNTVVLAFVAGAAVQITLIISADVVKNYFFSNRQILPFHVFSLFLAAVGVTCLWEMPRQPEIRIIRLPEKYWQLFSGWGVKALVLCLFVGLSIPALVKYYQWPKSIARNICEVVTEKWMPGDKVLVYPPWSDGLYSLYLRQVFQREDIAESIVPMVDIYGNVSFDHQGRDFLIYTHRSLSETPLDIEKIEALGFKPLLISQPEVRLGLSVFVR